MNTLQTRAHSYRGSKPANRQQTTTNGDRCPICGQPIAAIVSRAPGVHEIRPCGHELGLTGDSLATLTTREAALENDRDRDDQRRLIPDGGVTERTPLDQQLGSLLEAWINRDVPEDRCRFCNETLEDPSSFRYCDEECESWFDDVLEARIAIGQRDLEQRGFD